MIRLSLACLVSLALGGAAFAADTGTGNPAGMAPSAPQAKPGMPAPRVLNENDRLFIREATIGGTAEVQAGQLAERKGDTQPVKDFAQRMVQDHRKANNVLADIAKADRVPQPDQLDEEHRVMHSELEKMSGNLFDRAYISGQIGDHQKTAQLLEWEIGSGENEQLKSYAADTLPVVLQHLEMAQDIQGALAERAPGAGAPQISEKPKSGTPEQPR